MKENNFVYIGMLIPPDESGRTWKVQKRNCPLIDSIDKDCLK